MLKLNKFLICVAVSTALLGCSDKQSALTYIEKVKSDVKYEHIKESFIDLKNAIRIEPKNAEARFLIGKLYLFQGNALSAEKELTKALELKFNPIKVIPLLARAHILTKSDSEVLDLDKKSATLPSDIRVQYLAYKTLAAIRTQDLVLAKATVDLANSLSTTNVYSMLANAYLAFSENGLQKTMGLVSRILVANAKNPDALLLQGQVATSLGEYKKATESYLKYAEVQPESNIIILFIAESYLKEKNFIEAEAYADKILVSVPNQPFAQYVKAVARFENNDYIEASKHAELALNANFNQVQLKLIAGASAYFQDNFEQSHRYLGDIIKYLPGEHPARKMFAVSQLQLGLVGDISESLSGFNSTTDEDAKFLSTLSIELAELGAYEDARELSNKSLETNNSNNEKNSEQIAREGILKLMLNDPSGLQDLKDAVALEPDSKGAELALAYAAIQTKDFEQALAISQKWLKQYPEEAGGYNILAGVYLKQQNAEKATEALTKSLEILPKNMFALIELTNLAQHKKDLVEAERLSTLAVEYFPQNIRVLKQRYVLFKMDQSPAAKEKLAATRLHIKKLYQSDKTELTYGLLYSEVLLDNKEFKQAITVLDSYATSIKSPKKLWQLKLISQRGVNDETRVLHILEEWQRTNPYHIEPVLFLVDNYTKNKQIDRAIRLVNKTLIQQKGDDQILKMVKMQLLLESKKLGEAKALYQELLTDKISEPIANGLLGRIYLLEKNYQQALPLIANFYQTYPSGKNALLLASALQGTKQTTKAISSLEQHLQKNPKDNQVRAILANYYLKDQPLKATGAYETMLTNQPNNVVVLNNLAWLYLEKGKVSQALEYASRAYKIAPQLADVADTYGQALLQSGEKRSALTKAGEAYKLSKGQSVDITLNYVALLVINQRKNEAKRLIKTVEPQTTIQKEKKSSLIKQL